MRGAEFVDMFMRHQKAVKTRDQLVYKIGFDYV